MSTSRIRRHAVALPLAVAVGVIVLGGVAGAATLITGAQIQDGSVYGRDLHNGSVNGTDVKDASLTPADYDGPVVGPTGPSGPAGPEGLPGVRGVQYHVGAGIPISSGDYTAVGHKLPCPAGTKALSGGVGIYGPVGTARVLNSWPLNGGAAWSSYVMNESGTSITLYPWVVCAKA
jgi:hypothetical protein